MIRGDLNASALWTFSVLLMFTNTLAVKDIDTKLGAYFHEQTGEKQVAVDSKSPSWKIDKHGKHHFSEKDPFNPKISTNPEMKLRRDYDKFGDYDGMQVDQPLSIIDHSRKSNNKADAITKNSNDSDIAKWKKSNDGFIFAPQMDSDGHSSSEVWKAIGRLGQMDKLAPGKVDCVPTPEDMLAQMLGAAFNSRYMSIGKPSLRDTHPLAIDQKMDGAKLQDEADRSKKISSPTESFAVSELFTRILDDEPMYNKGRSRRSFEGRHHHTKFERRQQHHQHHTVRPSSLNSDDVPSSSIRMLDTWIGDLPALNTDDLTVERFLQYIRRSRSVSSGPPWHCQSRVQWVDLGRQYFPRYLRTTECTAEKCWYGHFRCQARAFTVKLLRRRKDSCEVNSKSDAVDERIPPSMQEEWVFEERAVTFCCECTM